MLRRKKAESTAPRILLDRFDHEFSISMSKKSQLVETLRNDHPVGFIEEMKKNP
jgi:hypothetical protein